MLPEPTIHSSAFVADTARIYGTVTVGRLVVVMFGAVIRAELDRITIGDETNLQDNVVVHCDADIPTDIGVRVTVGHAAVVHGATVGDHCLVGMGSILLNGSSLGEGAWLAAGSVLTPGRSVEPWTLAAGTPARPVRSLTAAEIAAQDRGVEEYLAFAEHYRQHR
ncbi:MAG: gamma carbonic anhydrase family protein [Acidimicrobiia bacterium]|nr:gamma carbonic anhydrase family protein [Acidimicrobiia bacterium]